MGGSGQPAQPTPPAQPSTADSIQAWTENMPAVFEEQQRQAPLDAQQQLELLQQYGVPLAEAYRLTEKAANPEAAALQTSLTEQATEGMQSDVPQWMQDEYLSNRSAQLGTNVGSPVAADYQSTGLLQQKQEWQNYYRNMALSISGRQPVGSGQSPQTANYTQGFTPGSVMNMQASTYAPYANSYTSMYNTNAQIANQPSGFGQVMGSLAGGIGSGIGTGMGYSFMNRGR